MSSANPPPPFDADAARRLCDDTERLWHGRLRRELHWHDMNKWLTHLRAAVAEVERLRADVHTCPRCGVNCKQCECWNRELQETERDRDDARRRVEALEKAGSELVKYVNESPCICSSQCDYCKKIVDNWTQALAAPGTGGTTGGTT
jgi:hypothetical protein